MREKPEPSPQFLTHKGIVGFKPAATGSRYEVMDLDVPGLGVRVSDKVVERKAVKTFFLVARFPGGKLNKEGRLNPERRPIGRFRHREGDELESDAISLEEARVIARRWKGLIKKQIDPRATEREAIEAAERAKAEKAAADEVARGGLFSAVAEAFLLRPDFKRQRRSAQVEREIRRELLDPSRNPWLNSHVTAIDDSDIASVITAIRDRPAPYQAYNVLGHARAIFRWARRPENRRRYGLVQSPLEGAQPRDFGLKKEPRQRVLTDLEIAAFWRAAGRLGYPNGPLFKLLLATGQRKSEIAEASWPEVSQDQQLLTIPLERFKSEAEHMVPLSPLSLELLAALPRFAGKDSGEFLFSTRNGRAPVNGFSNAKEELDRRILRALRAYARFHGDDPTKVKLEPFVLHDLRRTVRTRLSALKVPEPVAELVIGHGKKGLDRIYNHHRYLPEMRQALEEWAASLLSIVERKPANVVRLQKRA